VIRGRAPVRGLFLFRVASRLERPLRRRVAVLIESDPLGRADAGGLLHVLQPADGGGLIGEKIPGWKDDPWGIARILPVGALDMPRAGDAFLDRAGDRRPPPDDQVGDLVIGALADADVRLSFHYFVPFLLCPPIVRPGGRGDAGSIFCSTATRRPVARLDPRSSTARILCWAADMGSQTTCRSDRC